MNNPTTTVNELSFSVHNAYQLLLNNEIDIFIEMFDKINTNVIKTTDDNLALLKLIDDVKKLIELMDIKNKEISANIISTRKHSLANQFYR